MLAYPGSAPHLLVSLLSLDSHLPVHDFPDRWIQNFSLTWTSPLSSRSAYLIAHWTSLPGCLKGTINSLCSSFNSYLSLENAVSLSQWKASPPKLVCKSEIWQFPLAVSLFLSSPSKPHQLPSPADFLKSFFFFFLICNLFSFVLIHTEKSLVCASFFDVVIKKHKPCNKHSGH